MATEDRADIDRIAELTGAARTTWFTYLGLLAFAGVTLLGVEDVDFFALDRSVDLPLVGVSVPVTLFFLFSAALVTVIHAYLHVFLEQLWHALGRAPPQVGDEPLAAAVAPWLVSEFALHARRRLRPGEPPAVEGSPLGALGVGASVLLLYLSGPIVLAGLWIRSQPAHLAWLTVAIGLMLTLSLVVTVLSLAALRRKLSGAPGTAPRPGPTSVAVAILATGVIAAVSVMRTEWDVRGASVTRTPEQPSFSDRLVNPFRPVPADLRQIRLTALTADWLPHDEALAVFRRDWCAAREVARCLEADLSNGDLHDAWDAHRGRWLTVQEKPDLSGRNLDHADLSQAFLPGVTLNGAQLRHADLWAAQMEGARLVRADLTGAGLFRAHLEQARLVRANLTNAFLAEVRATGANFRSADLTEATLAEADLRFAILNIADLPNARLREARLDHALIERADLSNADLSAASLVGTNLFQANLSGTDLTGAWLESARIHSTVFADAHLVFMYLQGQADFPTDAPDFRGATLYGSGLRTLDLSRAQFDGPEQLAHVFADGSVALPEGMARPCHWADAVLGDDAYFARWRGMVEALEVVRGWESFVPPERAGVVAIPPYGDCALAPAPDPVSLLWRPAFARD